jgi:hypothetical protein
MSEGSGYDFAYLADARFSISTFGSLAADALQGASIV